MTTAYRLSVEHVVALLTPENVIASYVLDVRPRGKSWRFRTCPDCGAKMKRNHAAIYRRRRDGVAVWTHHGHPCGGDMLDLVAVVNNIDRKRDLPRLLEIGAAIAGISVASPDIERRIAERIAADRARHERELIDRAAAQAAMSSRWQSLDRRSLVGERYLRGRGLDPDELRAQGDIIRYAESGDIAIAMRSFDADKIVGIQYRAPIGKGFSCEPWSEPDGSALVGRLGELDREGVDVAVVVEGLADSLAARLAFPGCAVFGAAGAAHLDTVASAVAKRIKDVGGWMLLVVDDDDAGVENGADAIITAQAEGLELDRSFLLVDIGEHHDLADAYAAGWRWTWPT